MKSNIILIGFMGVGKGTLARELAKKTGIFAVDTDDLIESLENAKIKEIFEQESEEYFRKLELKTAKWLQSSVKNCIISTGGGFYKVKNLKKIGKVIYLKSSFDAILKRILKHPNAEKKLKKRPLFQDIKKAKKLFKQRVKEYQKVADKVVMVENKTIDEIAKEIEVLIDS
jgi:shikimate kinase